MRRFVVPIRDRSILQRRLVGWDRCLFRTPVQVCCDGRVTPGNACCGSVGYDQNRVMCCDGKIVYKSADYRQCCGQSSYNPDKQVNCYIILKQTQIVLAQICCDSTISGNGDKCCGSNPYASAKQICCAGQISYTPSGNIRCCGTKVRTNMM
jgi:hypothetical protein